MIFGNIHSVFAWCRWAIFIEAALVNTESITRWNRFQSKCAALGIAVNIQNVKIIIVYIPSGVPELLLELLSLDPPASSISSSDNSSTFGKLESGSQ